MRTVFYLAIAELLLIPLAGAFSTTRIGRSDSDKSDAAELVRKGSGIMYFQFVPKASGMEVG